MQETDEKVTARPSVHFYCPPALQSRIKAAAKLQRRSVSNFIVGELEIAVTRIEDEQKPANNQVHSPERLARKSTRDMNVTSDLSLGITKPTPRKVKAKKRAA